MPIANEAGSSCPSITRRSGRGSPRRQWPPPHDPIRRSVVIQRPGAQRLGPLCVASAICPCRYRALGSPGAPACAPDRCAETRLARARRHAGAPQCAESRPGAQHPRPNTAPGATGANRRTLRHRLSPGQGMLVGRTGRPDLLHRRQESPAKTRHAPAQVQVSKKWAKERSSWSGRSESVLARSFSRSCQQFRPARSQLLAGGQGHRAAGLLYFAAVPGL
jgi:hypothetical protein